MKLRCISHVNYVSKVSVSDFINSIESLQYMCCIVTFPIFVYGALGKQMQFDCRINHSIQFIFLILLIGWPLNR